LGESGISAVCRNLALTISKGSHRVISVKSWVLACWWQQFDRSFARPIAPVVTTPSIILSSNKIQNGDIPVPANPGPLGKIAVKREREERFLGLLSNLQQHWRNRQVRA